MTLWLRLGGWACFIAGGVFYFATGATLFDKQNLLPWVGFFMVLVGMVLTSTAPLMDTLAHRRKLREQIEERKASPPSPPAPPG
jgi:hypothetical protein